MSGTIAARQSTLRATRTVWSQAIQRRVMRLLSHLDPHLFQGQFRTFYAQSTHPNIPLLQFYDRYLRLLLLSEELLDDIMLRIQTQLSLQTDQIELREEAPTRGEIDWPHTLQRNLDELPDGTPLLFDTTMRKQSMATPENLFVIEVLQEYHQELQEVLTEDLKTGLFTDQERQQLATLDERLERLLSNPQVRTLMANISYVDIEQLAEQVIAQLRPGISPYRDLVTWWEQFCTLHIGSVSGHRQFAFASKRQEVEAEHWLYELWIALELIQFLHEEQALYQETLFIEADHIRFLFTWQERRFVFHYRRQENASAQQAPGWKHLSPVTATYTLAREHPLTITVGETPIWQEPPLPLRTVYAVAHTVEQCAQVRQAAIHRLLGEMQVLGAQHGMLLSANLAELPFSSATFFREITGDARIYIANHAARGSISEYQVTPDGEPKLIQQHVRTILQQAIDTLPEREPPACHGIVLDTDSINASRDRLVSGNVLCPKPHIGKGVMDIVHRERHCLKDPRLCHVFGQQLTLPFVIRATTLEEVNQQSSNVRTQSDQALSQAEESGDEARVEQMVSTIFLGVGRSIEQYVKMRGNTATIEAYYEEWIFGEYWKKHPRCLSVETRNILLSAAYVWDEYKQTTSLTDWAAPAVQYCRALETEIKRRLQDYYPQRYKQGGFDVPRSQLTLGAVSTICRLKDKDIWSEKEPKERDRIKSSQYNWKLFENIVIKSKCDITKFDDQLKRLETENIVRNRNLLAHGEAIPQIVAQQLRDSIIGRRGKSGVLCWLAENLDPKK